MGLEWKWLQAPLEVPSGGSAQDMLSREGLDCRLHIGGWYGLSSPLTSRSLRGGGNQGQPAQEQKSLYGIPAGCATCPWSSKEGCGNRLLLVLLVSSASQSRAVF